MINYEEIKNWFNEKENQQKVVLGACFVLVFIIGFGAGKFYRQEGNFPFAKQSNYTTKAAVSPPPAVKTGGGDAPVAGAKEVKAATTNCIVKGNINAKGVKLYHVLGGAFYKIVKPEQCFATEAEAQAAGFVKSSR